jgi:hypothetical protein
VIFFLIPAAYQLFAILACLEFRRQHRDQRQTLISVLKPVRGTDGNLEAALASHSKLDGDYELLCGVSSLDDPAVAIIRKFPKAQIVECKTVTPTQK